MDLKLQKLILSIVAENNGIVEWRHLINKVLRKNWPSASQEDKEKATVITKHQMDLLEAENKVIRKDNAPEIRYILTAAGHRALSHWLSKTWHFILYEEHNVFVLLAVLISIGSLIVSAIALAH